MGDKSSVGDRRTYEADDQRKYKQSEIKEMQKDRHREGEPNSHLPLDSKDQKTIANKLEHESKIEQEKEQEKSLEDLQHKKDATLPARAKGNEPSKGAKIDQQIREEEEEELKKKGKFGPNVD